MRKVTKPQMRAAAVAGAIGAALTGVAAPAIAHVVYESDLTFYTPTLDCVSTYSEISHGGGGGYNRADAYNWWYDSGPNGGACGLSHTESAFHTRAGFYNVVKITSSPGYQVCTVTSPFWVIDSTSDSHFWIYANSGATPPCGTGKNYGTFGFADHFENGNWRTYPGTGTPPAGYGEFSGWHSF